MIVRFRCFVLDTPRRQLRGDDGVRHLTPKAFDLLALLVREAPRVVPMQELHERLWPDAHVTDATLVGLVKEVRRVLDDHDADAPIIRTAHRVGYAFAADVAAAASSGPVVPDSKYWLMFDEHQILLVEGENVVGRDPASGVHVDHAGVSRRHARITVTGDDARIEDLGSKNGTTVGGTPVAGAVALRDRDRCAFGPVVAVFRAWRGDGSTLTQARASNIS
jgi:DNA-binding winged helix-turn-helix (wHTH) protein